MILSIDHEDLLKSLLKGHWYGSVAIPLEVGDALRAQDPEGKLFYLEKQPTWMFYELWTIEGWANEKERRNYLVSISKKPKQIREVLKAKMMQAALKGDMDQVAALQKDMNECSQT